MNKNTDKILRIVLVGLFMALVCIATLFFKVQIPGGYAHLGNGFIFLAAVVTGNVGGMIAAGFGSALADFLGGYTEWVIPTLIIKCSMGFITAAIMNKDLKKTFYSVRTAIALIVGTIVMVTGYAIATGIYYGYPAGVAAIFPLIMEDLVGIAVFYIIGISLLKTGVFKLITKGR